MSLKFWRKEPDPTQERIAAALEKLVLLVSLELRSKGISHSLEEGNEEGEIYYDNVTPREVFEQQLTAADIERARLAAEWESELRRRTDFATAVWAGPEGAEDAADTL